MAKRALLIMAYGSPNKLEDIKPFYTDIRRGVPPTPELLEELTERYKMIGGASPLLRITTEQMQTISESFDNQYPCYLGMRHWEPWIEEAVEQMYNDGIEEAVGMVMAPHFSTMSIAKYIGKVEKKKEELNYDLKINYVQSWHDHPAYIDALIDRVNEAETRMNNFSADDTLYMFTAHSLPERILATGDPYKNELMHTCELIADKKGIKNWTFAFQSAGRTQEKWLGPDILEAIQEFYDKGTRRILVCSIGFITDHLEVIYDIDFEAQNLAKELGIDLVRAESLNNEPKIGDVAKDLISKAFETL